MRLDRPFADEQLFGDLGVRPALGDGPGHVEFACCQRREVIRGRGRHTGGLASLSLGEEGGRLRQTLGKVAVVTGDPPQLTRSRATTKPVTRAALG
jgi:hypothetical protein